MWSISFLIAEKALFKKISVMNVRILLGINNNMPKDILMLRYQNTILERKDCANSSSNNLLQGITFDSIAVVFWSNLSFSLLVDLGVT